MPSDRGRKGPGPNKGGKPGAKPARSGAKPDGRGAKPESRGPGRPDRRGPAGWGGDAPRGGRTAAAGGSRFGTGGQPRSTASSGLGQAADVGKPPRSAEKTGPSKAEKRVAEATRGAKPFPDERGAKPSARGGAKPAGRPGAKPAGRDERPARPARGPVGERPARGPVGERPARPPRVAAGPARDRAEQPGSDELELETPETREADIVYGRHPAIAALESDRPVNKVWLLKDLKNQELVGKVRLLAKEKGATVQYVERPKLDALTLDANHQGIVVSIASATYIDLDEAITAALAKPNPAILVLDGIEDPHNLGALIRTAEGADFAAVVIPGRRAVGLTPTVAKASAGAVDRVPVARVINLAQALQTLKKAGFWLVGADAGGEKLPYELDLTQPLVLVIGGEGKGLSRLLAERCDVRVHLPLGGELESLNASVAGALIMYEAVRQRWAAGEAKA